MPKVSRAQLVSSGMESLDQLPRNDLLRHCPHIGVKVWNVPIIPDLMGVGQVAVRLREMRIDRGAHLVGHPRRKKIVFLHMRSALRSDLDAGELDLL